MRDLAIQVEGLSKRYRIGKGQTGRTFREALAETLSTPLRRTSESSPNSDFWALKDVSFDVARGEVVGIIGRNGAGKSTLLKILSRITEPTSGFAQVFGRIGSLLEVGTGFHPELTGRENVYLNGAILGMKRREIDRQFDEIVHFAEVPQFIDTPVKHYSSGMYVRLAFAVAAHLEPEILIVDEVLAVGDAAFQARCIEHFQRMQDGGKTVLLISHNLGLVRKVCRRAVLLEQGSIIGSGDPTEVLELYDGLQRSLEEQKRLQSEDPGRWGTGVARITAVYTVAAGKAERKFDANRTIQLVIEFEAVETLCDVVVGFAIHNSMNQLAFATNSLELGVDIPLLEQGRSYRAEFTIDNVFGDSTYTVSCAVNNLDRTRPYCRLENAHSFEVTGHSARSPIWPRHGLTIEENGS